MLSRVASSMRKGASNVGARYIHATGSSQQIYDNVLQTIGNTPVVRLNSLPTRDDVTIYAKLEYFNPLSSVKDRLAFGIIEAAEQSGKSPTRERLSMHFIIQTYFPACVVCFNRGNVFSFSPRRVLAFAFHRRLEARADRC